MIVQAAQLFYPSLKVRSSFAHPSLKVRSSFAQGSLALRVKFCFVRAICQSPLPRTTARCPPLFWRGGTAGLLQSFVSYFKLLFLHSNKM